MLKEKSTKMNKLKIVTLLAILLLGIATVNAQDTDSNVAITLERTPCFGGCPVYTVTIYEDGAVVYNGIRFVDVTGEQTYQIEPETVATMLEAIENTGYFEWEEEYNEQTISDLPTVITSVTRGGETHRIVRYTGDSSAPLALPFLEQWIDIMARTPGYTGTQADASTISDGRDTPMVTLERQPCFGFCPVYSVALYEDGAIVYSGFANVDRIGVFIFETEAFNVEFLTQRAEMSGYFTWQDAYQQQLMTDQATVITSVRTEDNWKRIIRYDGDPNAPVGLIWIEENIDQIVTDATS
jgi:hypothetical protein